MHGLATAVLSCSHFLVCLQGCNTEAVRVLLGGEGLRDSNMLAHLGIIEQRSNELLQVGAHSLRGPQGATPPGAGRPTHMNGRQCQDWACMYE